MRMIPLTAYMAEKAALDLYRQFLKLSEKEQLDFLLHSGCNWPDVWKHYIEQGELTWPNSQ
jgi:hypothetical protein